MSLADAIRAAGWNPPQNIPTGKTTRFATCDKGNDRNGWVYPFSDGTGAVYGCWRTGEVHTWQIKRDRPLSKAELTELRRKAERAKRLAEIEREQRHQQSAIEAAQIVKDAKPAPAKHGYLLKKRIKPHGLKVNTKGQLIVPLYDSNVNLANVQTIAPSGQKLFLKGGQVKGCFAIFGDWTKDLTILICEGVATAISLHENTGKCVIAAMSAGNLLEVSQIIRSLRPDAELILCGDNDPSGLGETKARQAAIAVNAKLLMPPVIGDWNDYLTSQAANVRVEVTHD